MSQGWVYKIFCSSNSYSYIGSTTDKKGPETRRTRHFWELRSDRHHNLYLQRAWNKYGEGSFSWSILEETTAELVLSREQYHLDLCELKFNTCKVTGTTRGIRHPPRTSETRKKLSEARRGKGLGKPCRPETREKIAAAQRGPLSRLWGKRGKDAINYGRKKPKGFSAPDSTAIVDQNGTIYGSQHEAARILGLNLGHVNAVVRGKRKTVKGYIFRYAKTSSSNNQ